MYIALSLMLLVSLGVQKSMTCHLQEDLCMFNLFGFSAQKDADGEVLRADMNRSYIQSVTYKEISVSTCTIQLNYSASPDSGLLLEVITKDETFLPIAHLTGAATLREVPLNPTSQPFAVRLTAISTSNFFNITVSRIRFYMCSPPERMCSVEKGVFCNGWNESHPSDELGWTAEEGYMQLNTHSNSTYMNIMEWWSPDMPYKVGSECQITYRHYSANFESTPQVFLMLYMVTSDSKDRKNGFPLPWSSDTQEEWQTAHISFLFNDKSLEGFQVIFSGLILDSRGKVRIANVSFSDSCFPGLVPIDVNSSLSYKAETLYAYITLAANLSVANRSTSYWFLPCQSRGSTGPTAEQCKQFYDKSNRPPFVSVTMDDQNMPGVQIWTVPKDNFYDINLYGASGGYGVETVTSPGLLRGYTEFWNSGHPLSVWPARQHIHVWLAKGERLYIIVGQSGANACDQKMPELCPGRNKTGGGGGGGGGASLVYLERNGTITLLAVAGGGGGMGRKDQTYNKEPEALLTSDNETDGCRPGIGGSHQFNPNQTLLQQDGQPLSWPFRMNGSFQGGQGCEEYLNDFNSPGGFGGGGGGCTAGGGGGGYKGGESSWTDAPLSAGMQGTSYWNKDLVKYQTFKQFDPFTPKSPEGFVEITELAKPCQCNGLPCQWTDGTYTEYMCLCNKTWIPPHNLFTCVMSRTSNPRLLSDTHLIIISCVVPILPLSAIIIFAIRWKRKNRAYRWKQQFSESHMQLKMDVNPTYAAYDGLPDALPEERITIIRHLGEGRFSKVFEARLALTDSWNSAELTVAIKKPKDNSPQTRAEFLQEARTISAFNHPNIIKIIGICEFTNGIIGIAMDVLRGGDLNTFLKENRPDEQNSPSLLFGDLIKIASQIVSACRYLEENKFIHRDIAARNVLLTEKGPDRIAKISDFGLSRDINHEEYCGSLLKPVPIKWYPPEAVIQHKHTSKSDVWSYGVLLWEIFSYGEQPYPGMELAEVAEKLKEGYTMDPPKTCPEPIGKLMSKCWMYHPTDRPDFSFVHLQLSRMLENEALMNAPIGASKHERLSSVTSSASSGFDELPDSPSCLSMKPLLDASYCNGIDHSISNAVM